MVFTHNIFSIFDKKNALKTTYVYKLILVFYCINVISFSGYSQSKEIRSIQDSIFELNKKKFYTLSQNILDSYIKNDSTGPDSKIYLYISKADTYKFTDDYVNVARMLDSASLIKNTTKKTYFKTLIDYNRCLVFYDTRAYDLAKEALKTIAPNIHLLSYKALANIRIMNGYFDYKNQNYNKAETQFNEAINILKAHKNTANLPLIYHKQMSLYAKIEQLDAYKTAYKNALYYSDLLGIEKYKRTTLLVLNDLIATPSHFKSFNQEQKQALYKELKAFSAPKEHSESNLNLIITTIIIALTGVSFLLHRYRNSIKTKQEIPSSINNSTSKAEKHLKIYEQLNERQIEIIKLVIEGKSNTEIAKTLHLSTSTIKYHLSKIYEKLEVKNRVGLFALLNKNERFL